MKKTLLAAALVTGFAGVAHAESSVTLYGIVDAGYGYQESSAKFKGGTPGQNGKITKSNTGAHSGVQNGSRWGLKGSEDLGNGTSAIFVLESGFDVTDGTQLQGDKDHDRLFGRQAYVGLTGESWGTFTIGRQYNAGESFVVPISPFGAGWGYAATQEIFGGSVFARYDSVLKYVSPDFSGFKFGIGLVHDNSDTEYKGFGQTGKYEEEDTTTGVTTGLSYNSGPLYIGATFDYYEVENEKTGLGRLNKSTGTGKSDSKTKAWNIGGTYDFDVVKLHLLYGGQKDGSIGKPGLAGYGVKQAEDFGSYTGWGETSSFFGDGYSQHSWLVGLSAPVGDAGTVLFSYSGSVADNDKMFASGEEWEAKTHSFSLGYRHAISKRTSVYGVASYGWSDLESDARGNREIETKRSQAIIGLQHRF
ncbi:porin [Oligella ureolytica]